MRKLYLRREKAFTGCAVPLQVFVTTSAEKATRTIEGFPCRELGSVKNGKVLEGEIPECMCFVYVDIWSRISDVPSKYQIPEGTDPVYLSCKMKMGFIENKIAIRPDPKAPQNN